MAPDHLIAARAEALFASDLSAHCHLSEAVVAAAIRHAVRAHGGVRGCAGEVGAAYGDHPETAAARMRWARQVIEAIYSPTATSATATVIGTGRASYTNQADRPVGNGVPVMTSLRHRGSIHRPDGVEGASRTACQLPDTKDTAVAGQQVRNRSADELLTGASQRWLTGWAYR